MDVGMMMLFASYGWEHMSDEEDGETTRVSRLP